MHRFYIDRVSGDTVILADPAQLHHLRDVLRLKVNDRVILFDSRANEYQSVIIRIDKKQAELKISPLKPPRRHDTKLTVACAIPKGSRIDDIIDYLAQLGVHRIIPMRTERVVVRLDANMADARLRRWQKIAQSAVCQSQGSKIPLIEPVTNFENVVADAQKYDLKLIPHLSGERRLIRDVVTAASPKDIIVLIGPEGDFTPAEVELALSKGFIPVSLGDTVLRVAAAAVAVASYIKFCLGE